MRTLGILLLFALFNTFAHGQSGTSINDVRNVFDEKGDYYFDKKDYKKAIVYFNMAYDANEKNLYSVLRKAEAFEKLGLYDQAAECYRVIFNSGVYVPNEFRLQYAVVLLKNKDIKGYEKWLKEYNKEVTSEISGYVGASDVRAKMYKDSSIVMVENESVLNSPESETSPALMGNQLLFSSTRKDLAGNFGSNHLDVYSASYVKGGQLGKLNTYSSKVNTAKNEAATAFSGKTNNVYITRSTGINTGYELYVANIATGDGSVLDVKKFVVEGKSSIGHVTFNSTGDKAYFVSGDAGGSGGLDIYSAELVGGKWANAKNLGSAVNTAKDELYPCVLHDTLLYFSTAGHGGQGGIDLFVANLNKPDAAPKNLGSKINSKADDFALTFSPDGLTGYFCSNRDGGMGKEDIYRLHLVDTKVKLAAYKFKRTPSIKENKINLYLSDGEEYNISSDDNTGFDFGFQPEEGYKLVIQHENPFASNIIYDSKLTPAQKEKKFLRPTPFDRTDIRLDAGMRYDFNAGMKPLSNAYKKELDDMAGEYQGGGGSGIDLTALARELFMEKGEIYTIRFEKDDTKATSGKSKEVTSLFVNGETIPLNGRSFFIVLPLDIQANFNITTDIEHFKEAFNPKKVGAVKVDAKPVIAPEPEKEFEGFPVYVNTEDMKAPKLRKVRAKEFNIIPGSMYILSIKDKNMSADDPGLVIPLTKGVKYNLGTEIESEEAYNKQLQQMQASQGSEADGELIDISVLSKELSVVPEEELMLTLVPAKQFGASSGNRNQVMTTINVDGRKYYVSTLQKFEVRLKLPASQKMAVQTDLSYIKDNFVASTIALNVDTSSFNRNIAQINKPFDETEEIDDPVFDVVIVNFDLNDYTVRPDAKEILTKKVIRELTNDSRLYVTITGYTDGLGDAEHNKQLSQNRSMAVKKFLSSNGIGDNRIRTFSFGESLSLDSGVKWEDLSEEELQKHRKVEIIIYLPK